MVKKKTRRKVVKPPQPKLDTVFNCYKCGHKKTIEVKFNKKEKLAYLRCKACGLKFETKIRPADAYIDIYYKWIDEIEEKEKKKNSEEESQEKDSEDDKDYDDKEPEEKEEEEDESEKNKKEENNDNDDDDEKEDKYYDSEKDKDDE